MESWEWGVDCGQWSVEWATSAPRMGQSAARLNPATFAATLSRVISRGFFAVLRDFAFGYVASAALNDRFAPPAPVRLISRKRQRVARESRQ